MGLDWGEYDKPYEEIKNVIEHHYYCYYYLYQQYSYTILNCSLYLEVQFCLYPKINKWIKSQWYLLPINITIKE